MSGGWDLVVITASSARQAASYEAQLTKGHLPETPKIIVIPDEGRFGSGGATLRALKRIKNGTSEFSELRIAMIHSGGDSKRIPQYAERGKLFANIAVNGLRTTPFDAHLAMLNAMPTPKAPGVFILCGDLLPVCDPDQFDLNASAGISIKTSVETGTRHGVFESDNNGNVRHFFHKKSSAILNKIAENGQVDADTGICWFDMACVESLLSIPCSDACLNLYGDFLYPMAAESTLDEYLTEQGEYKPDERLAAARRDIWAAVGNRGLRLVKLDAARFIHFGTTREWFDLTAPNIFNSAVDESVILDNCIIEDSIIEAGCKIGKNCVISGVRGGNFTLNDNCVLHMLKLKDGKYVARIYGIDDNPKLELENATYLNEPLTDYMKKTGLTVNDLWDEEPHTLWDARLFPIAKTQDEALAGISGKATRTGLKGFNVGLDNK